MTNASEAEQASAGLHRLSAAELERFRELNAAYRANHGFPFIVCVRHYTKAGILAELARRGSRETAAEREEALAQDVVLGVAHARRRAVEHVAIARGDTPAQGMATSLRTPFYCAFAAHAVVLGIGLWLTR